MKCKLLLLVFFYAITPSISQTINHKKKNDFSEKTSYYYKNLIEDRHNHITNDSTERLIFERKQKLAIKENSSNSFKRSTLQTPVHLCSNGNFEEFENVNGSNVLKHFQYTYANPINPTQCKSTNNIAGYQYIKRYNPANSGLMASTVPSNYLDEYIGNINAFDQYTLKVNFKESSLTSGIVHAQRFKTNNETDLKFNYKVVLQSISESGHTNEQPFFKVRVINKNGIVVDEFCNIGDPTNCIFTQAPNLENSSIVLFTKNWQSGILDISSIPNNEEFTIEFNASRCGLGGHFGYAYIDDMCLLNSNETLEGSIELDPLFKICPVLPISVCGSYTIPNSGGISAPVNSIKLNVYDNSNTIIYTSSTPLSLDTVNKRFCFELTSANIPNIINGNYNVGVSINYGSIANCTGTNFTSATDNDANTGWDISFLNCTAECDITLETTNLILCDTNKDGKEFFNLTDANVALTGTQTGLTFAYFTNITDVTANTNPIINFSSYESYTSTIFVRVIKDATCYKIIAFQLTVKNPSATISGILNICSGSTTLTASSGSNYTWSNGNITQSTIVTNTGIYSVTVTDSNGCISTASTEILPNQVAVLPTIVIKQPDCFKSTGTITVTSPAAEFSYDDGNTWTTNSQLNNVPVGIYNVKIKTASGCYSYSSQVNIVAYLTSFPNFSNNNPTSCGGFGSITISTIGTQYSFDDGITWSSNNTMNNLPIGTYLIRTKNEFGCISNFNSVAISGEFLSSPQYIAENPYCSNLGKITITTLADGYSFDGGTTWQSSNVLGNLTSGSYIIKIKNNQGCTSPNVYVYLNNFEYSYPNFIIDEAGCDKYATLTITTFADSYSFDDGITWSTTNTLSNLNGGTSVRIKIRRGTNCFSYTNYVTIYSYFRPLPTVANYSTLICDTLNNGNENINLSTYNSFLVTNSSSYTFSYYNTLNGATDQNFSQLINNFSNYNLDVLQRTIYVRITDNYGCASVANLDFTLIKTPEIQLLDKYILCEKSTVTITENTLFDSYNWSTGSTDNTTVISTPGNYTLTVTENHGSVVCSTTKTFAVVLSNPATFQDFQIEDWTMQDNIVTINVTGLGNYEYSLDGINYQDSNIFYGVKKGEHQVFVRDKNKCGITTTEIYLLIHPKYFTPNGDGFNDTWKIKFGSYETNLKVKIFDFYGKFLKELDSNSSGWDGFYNGQPMPASDYWFVVTRANGKEHKGHFTLKR